MKTQKPEKVHQGRFILDLMIAIFAITTYCYAMEESAHAIKGLAITVLLLTTRVILSKDSFGMENE